MGLGGERLGRIHSTVRLDERSQAHMGDSVNNHWSKVIGELSGRGTIQPQGVSSGHLQRHFWVSPSLPDPWPLLAPFSPTAPAALAARCLRGRLSLGSEEDFWIELSFLFPEHPKRLQDFALGVQPRMHRVSTTL